MLSKIDPDFFLEMDLAVYDHIFTGMSEEKCRELIHDGRPPNGSERGLSIVMLEGKYFSIAEFRMIVQLE